MEWTTKKRKLDVVIVASSRLTQLKYTIDKFLKFAHFYGDFRFILHEDFVFPKESEKVIIWAEAQKDIFNKKDIHWHNPPIGLIDVTSYVLKLVETPFFFNLQDDWVFERPIEVDRILRLMEKINDLNLIVFAKHKIPKVKSGVKLHEFTFPKVDKGIVLTQYYTWSFIPAIWRTNFSRPICLRAMKTNKKRTAPARMTNTVRPAKMKYDVDYLRKHMGAFFYGGHGEWRWVRHIGEDARMEEWRLKNGKPGSEGIHQETNIMHLAPWIPFEHIPPIPNRNSEEIIKKELERRRGKKYDKQF